MNIITKEQAFIGREEKIPVLANHAVLEHATVDPLKKGMQQIMFGMGCFWGAERKFWELAGVHSTAVGYSAGHTQNPSYQEVCTGGTGHNEVVLVQYDPTKLSLATLLKTFWQSHNPTQGMRQGNDQGTQYRSGIYVFNAEQKEQAEQSRTVFQQQIHAIGTITTEIIDADTFYYAEDYHQQYLHKKPNGYCGLGGLGVVYGE
jgi:peptide-methionine (S)-S-oxide reductase